MNKAHHANYNDKFIHVRLEALSPVHIGAGKDAMLSPLDYQIAQEENGCWLYTVDTNAWLSSYSDPAFLATMIENASLNEVWAFFRKELPRDAFMLSKSKVSKEIYKTYLARLTSKESKNELASATRNPLTQAMVIPGSSIKGSISTAVIDSLDRGDLRAAGKGYTKQLEEWFGKIGEHAFQALKVSDFELLPNASEFMRPYERKLNVSKEADAKDAVMKDICEVMPRGIELYGRLLFGRTSGTRKRTPLSHWSFENIAEICYAYYRKRLDFEYKNFYSQAHFATSKAFIEELMENVQQAKSGKALLLRVGHYSHIESITVTNNKPQTPLLPKPQKGNYPWGTTRTLANGKYPFGWILLHKVDEEEYRNGLESLEKEKTLILQDIQTKQEQAMRIQTQKAQAKQAHEDAQEAEAKAKAEAEKVFKSLSPAQQDEFLLSQSDVIENKVTEIYQKLSTYSDEDKVLVAQALKSYYIANGKWEKQKKKQLAKVNEIKTILGES